MGDSYAETMFIAVTRIHAPKEAQERMADGFRRGGVELKRFPGFVGFELWRNDDTLEAVSRWESREAMEAYRDSPMFGAHHGPPGPGGGSGGVAAETVAFDGETIV
jgi:heme-degrading monooxygenase HmoA